MKHLWIDILHFVDENALFEDLDKMIQANSNIQMQRSAHRQTHMTIEEEQVFNVSFHRSTGVRTVWTKCIPSILSPDMD